MQGRANDLIINQSFSSSHCKIDNATDHLHQENNYRITFYLHHRTLKNSRTKQCNQYSLINIYNNLVTDVCIGVRAWV